MLRATLIAFLTFIGASLCLELYCQNSTWTWMRGSQLAFQPGNYGIQTVSSPTNEPPTGYEFAEWTDLNGNFWILGGLESASGTYHTALWRYTPANNEWTWMKGPPVQNAIGVYGTQGVPSPANFPGARSYGARTWTDNNGFLWLFGGYGFDGIGFEGLLNDLWRYDIATNEWTWMKGPQVSFTPANYGVQGVPATSNLPPGTSESAASWVDANNNLWMYGGDSFGQMTDNVWRYDPATNLWTWMSGQNAGQVPVNYGTLGVPSPTNTPGGRWPYAHWQDQAGNFWVFGGMDITISPLADMWMYNPNTGIWTWMAGSNQSSSSVPVTNTFTATCIPGGYPDAIYENRACWTDQCGRFWGIGGEYNYLWCFNPATLQFTWVSGSLVPQVPPVYGTQTIPAATNVPAPVYGGNGFVDNSFNFWLFGGYNSQIGELNLLWKLQPDLNCLQEEFEFNFPLTVPAAACTGTPITFSPQSEFNFGYFWDFGDPNTTADTSSLINPTWTYTQPGTYTYTLIVTSTILCTPGTDTLTGVITISPSPTVNLGNDSLFCNGINNVLLDAGNPGASYLWNTGDTTQTITVTSAGTYAVLVTTDQAGLCTATDTIVFLSPAQITLGPDTSICSGATLMLDPGVTSQQYLWNTGDTTQTITVSASGVYSIQITTSACTFNDTIVVNSLPLPTVNLGNDTTICNPPFGLTLDAGNAGGQFNWSTGATSQTIPVNTAGSYSVLVRDGQCENSDTIVITVQTVPQPDLGNDTTICAGQFLLLNPGVTAQQYLWNTGDTTASIQVSTSGLYSVQVINQPCTLSSSINLSVVLLPVVNLGSDTVICSGPVNLLLDAGNAGSSYAWSTGATTQTLSVTAPGIYSVTVAAGPNGLCSVQDSLSITQPAQPNLGGDTILCAGQSLLLDPGVTGTQYNWSTGATTPTITVNAAGLYSVQIINAPCTLSSSMTLGITPLPVVNLGTDTTLCPGDSVQLDAQNPGAAFLWSNASTSQTITTSAAGTYAVTVTAQNCSNSDTIAIATTQNLAFDETVSLCGSSGPLVLDAGNPGAAYFWSTGDFTQTISIEQPGTYWVTVNAPPCVLTDTVLVTGNIGEAAVYVPNSFTPNGDGLNDRFTGYGESFSSFRLLIFNRWGELIFETTDPNGWDGNYVGQRAESEVYVYKLTYTSACTGGKFVDRLGSVTLIR